jgi:NAD(P)-dependent dehydrogenase (short-subunit alcohol dehydrogenase family)
MNRLSGRTAIVTGAARGIGAAYARGLAEEGAAVMLCDVADPQPVVEDIIAAGGIATGMVADVSVSDDVTAVVKATVDLYGGVTILVNNAAVFASLRSVKFFEIPTSEWDWVLAVNARGAFEFAKAVAPIMIAQHYGKIINISSGTFFKGSGRADYVVSKGAAVALTRVMAKDLGDDGICVNCIAPGLTMSEGVSENPEHAAVVPRTVATRCLKRAQTVDDLVGSVVFFSSAESDFITGQTLLVDGGSVLH